MNKVAEEINEMIHDRGSITLSELTNLYELPTDFIQQVMWETIQELLFTLASRVFYKSR